MRFWFGGGEFFTYAVDEDGGRTLIDEVKIDLERYGIPKIDQHKMPVPPVDVEEPPPSEESPEGAGNAPRRDSGPRVQDPGEQRRFFVMSVGASRETRARESNAPAGPPATGPFGRLLNLFAEVHAGEVATALLLMVNIFLLLAAYYLLKTIREPLILTGEGGGAEVKSYAAAAIAGLLIILVPLYSAIANRVSRVKLINGVTLFFIAYLVTFFRPEPGRSPGRCPLLHLGRHLQPDDHRPALGVRERRLHGRAGEAAVRDRRLRRFAGRDRRLVLHRATGREARPLSVHGGRGRAPRRLHADHEPRPSARSGAGEGGAEGRGERVGGGGGDGSGGRGGPVEKRNGFALVLSDRYLLLIACLMMILNLVNTTGEYILGETVSKIAADKAAAGGGGDPEKIIGGFYGNYFTWVNVISALIQAFVVSRVIKYAGVRGALLVLPIVALVGYTALAFLPVLGLIKSVKIAENSLDYSLAEHQPKRALPAHEPGGQVQGEAGQRHLLRPLRRRPLGRSGLRRPPLARISRRASSRW